MNEKPVDYDDKNDPDSVHTDTQVITDIVCFLGEPTKEVYVVRNGFKYKLEDILYPDDALIYVWSDAFHEQAEARLEQIGWKRL